MVPINNSLISFSDDFVGCSVKKESFRVAPFRKFEMFFNETFLGDSVDEGADGCRLSFALWLWMPFDEEVWTIFRAQAWMVW